MIDLLSHSVGVYKPVDTETDEWSLVWCGEGRFIKLDG